MLTILSPWPLEMTEPAFYLHPKSVLASRDETVEFKCAARGFPRPNITWIKDEMEFTDKNTQLSQRILNESVELVIKIVSVSDRHVGYYSCLATALNVRVSSRDAVLTLRGEYTFFCDAMLPVTYFSEPDLRMILYLVIKRYILQSFRSIRLNPSS